MSEERRSDSGAYSQLEKEKALIKERLAKNEEEMAQVKDEQAPPRRAQPKLRRRDLRARRAARRARLREAGEEVSLLLAQRPPLRERRPRALFHLPRPAQPRTSSPVHAAAK